MTQRERAAILMAKAVGDAIRDLGSVPSGHLYARLMNHVSLESYQAIVSALKRADLIEERDHLLTWKGAR